MQIVTPEHHSGRQSASALLITLVSLLLLAGTLGTGLYVHSQGRLAIATALPPGVPGALAEPHERPLYVTVYISNTAHALAAYFTRLDYRLRGLLSGGEVPRVFVRELPRDLEQLTSMEQRKALFLRSVLPLVLKENERLLAERERIRTLLAGRAAGVSLTRSDQRWLDAIAADYETAPDNSRELLRRVDEVPVSLALAQAAMESAWGTSRFLKEGNALFGMWTWDDAHPGIVPRDRDDKEHYRIRAFDSLSDSVGVYVHTLNTHWAYARFRQKREQLREAGKSLTGFELAGTVTAYSPLRGIYTNLLKAVILDNSLRALDGVRLVQSDALGPALAGVWRVALASVDLNAQRGGK